MSTRLVEAPPSFNPSSRASVRGPIQGLSSYGLPRIDLSLDIYMKGTPMMPSYRLTLSGIVPADDRRHRIHICKRDAMLLHRAIRSGQTAETAQVRRAGEVTWHAGICHPSCIYLSIYLQCDCCDLGYAYFVPVFAIDGEKNKRGKKETKKK